MHAIQGNKTFDDVPSTSGIYKITCLANMKIYIGSSLNLRKRKNEHFRLLRKNKHFNPHMQAAWNKYGEQSFVFEVLEVVLPFSKEAREQYWFSKLNPFSPNGFNVAPDANSTLGTKRSPESCIKIGAASRGRKPSLGVKARMMQAHLGKKHTPEAIEKIRQSRLGKKRSPETIEKTRQAHIGKPGRKRTPEFREALRQRNLGNTYALGNKNRLGKKDSPETREKKRIAHLAFQARKRSERKSDELA